jgi:hypothetical protein
MKQLSPVAIFVLAAALLFDACKPTLPPVPISEVKPKTGVVLPDTCVLLKSMGAGWQSDTFEWAVQINGTNEARFPEKLSLTEKGGLRDAELGEVEGITGVSIRNPIGVYYGQWNLSNSQSQATLVVTTNCQYLLLRYFPGTNY